MLSREELNNSSLERHCASLEHTKPGLKLRLCVTLAYAD